MAEALDPGFCTIGTWQFPPTSGSCTVLVSIEAEGKVDEKEADGKDDATTTWKGRKPASVKISLSWRAFNWQGQTPANVDIRAALKDLSPRGMNGGKAWEFTHCDAEVHGVLSIIIKKISGPKWELGSDKVTADIEAASWVKPAPKDTGAAKTPASASPWDAAAPGRKPSTPSAPQGFGGPSAPAAPTP